MSQTRTEPTTGERLTQLAQRLEDVAGFQKIVAALQRGEPASIDGAWGSACALLTCALANHCDGILVVVLPDVGLLDDFCDDLRLFGPSGQPANGTSDDADHHVAIQFPAWEASPGERPLHDAIYGERLRAIKLVSSSNSNTRRSADAPFSGVVVTSIQSLLQPTPSPETVAEKTRQLRKGDRIDPEDLQRWLVEQGFHHSTAVELPGEFSARGGIVDIFAPDWASPVRVEWFGDEVESLRAFDVASQRSLAAMDSVEITVLGAGLDNHGQLADFLPADSWFLLVEPEQAQEHGKHYLRRCEDASRFHTVPQVFARMNDFALVTAAAMSVSREPDTFALPVESVERFSGEVGRVREELESAAEDAEVYVVCQTEGEVRRLSEIFEETQLMRQGQLHFPLGRLKSGFRLQGAITPAADETFDASTRPVMVVSGAEMFHRESVNRAPRRHLAKAIDHFHDLREGDLVVHLSHGIGRFRGLNTIDKGDQVEEHLELEFREQTRIYVPSNKIDLVQKYIGGQNTRPRLAKIGGKSWARQRQAAESAVEDLAQEMLELQAERQARSGIAFGPDTQWQQEFDAQFPYHETPDQLRAMVDIKGDMQQLRPMDRLLCGDVGFGKTEMAIRAAFKAVDNGYQVAVLVPTTVLCEQHWHTFTNRMAEFPCRIEKLSRFCTAAEQRETVKALKSGEVDIVIGTHRLASKDIGFANLGLVVIDEEQRFGVDVKERLKSFRSTVDILTMSATPIPRTLHMSLTGVRDISNLQTPPEERVPVETKVTRKDEALVKHAILRELNRGGQVFFVHNRVNDIEIVKRWLQDIVPDASIRIGHGQMAEGELEKVMVDFIAGKFEILLATTIVESGLDIPNANTIFIDEADRYGLSDLHQLRGRVGRYKNKAYCYLLLDEGKMLAPNAARRLRAIEEYSEMGAGFALSMRDLEIRGAGNLLGSQQSGHIAAVGYELYCQLMERAVRQLKRMPPKLSIDVTLDLPGSAHFPRDYVPDMRTKIDLYRRLRRITGDNDLAELRQEMIDRFGPLPDPVKRLLKQTELRIDAAIWQVDAIHLEENFLVFSYTNRARIEQLAALTGKKLRIVDHHQAYLKLKTAKIDPDQLMAIAQAILRMK